MGEMEENGGERGGMGGNGGEGGEYRGMWVVGGCGGALLREHGTKMGDKWDDRPIVHSPVSPIFSGGERCSQQFHQLAAQTN